MSGRPSNRAVGLLIAIVVAASGVTASLAGAETGFCGRPTLPVDEASPDFEPRFGIDRKIAGPGGKVRIRVENFGAKRIAFGLAYRLARWEKGGWVHLPTGPFFAVLVRLQSGYASECQVVDIPRDAESGTYRVAKEVWLPDPRQRKSPLKSAVLRTTFRVR